MGLAPLSNSLFESFNFVISLPHSHQHTANVRLDEKCRNVVDNDAILATVTLQSLFCICACVCVTVNAQNIFKFSTACYMDERVAQIIDMDGLKRTLRVG